MQKIMQIGAKFIIILLLENKPLIIKMRLIFKKILKIFFY